jgi:RsiW-degrading membrane proteinase PrsW (M82 family)
MSYLLYILFGFFPSIAWLLFYLRADAHPEPKKEILAVFFLGAVSTIPAIILEVLLVNLFRNLGWSDLATAILVNVIGVAFIEEVVKYMAVWIREQQINQNRQLDEPVDMIIYMIVSALGFAAVENLMFLLPIVQMNLAMITSLFRALSAILLHTLCSGTVGYFLALSFCDRQRKSRLLIQGILIASFLHGLYNLFIMKSGESEAAIIYLYIPLFILAGLAVFLYAGFKKLKKMGSVCQIKEIQL